MEKKGHKRKTTYLTLASLCDALSISLATGRNWLRLGKIEAQKTEDGKAWFDAKYVSKLKREIQSGKKDALRSRRNKKYVSGNTFYASYLPENSVNLPAIRRMIEEIDESKTKINEVMIRCIVADCFEKLYRSAQKEYAAETGSGFQKLLCDLASEEEISTCRQSAPELFEYNYLYEPGEDVPGMLYISLSCLTRRKATGAYFTPVKVVDQLISELAYEEGLHVSDPACGTGIFLLRLPTEVPPERIHGNDIDETAVKITRLNLALKYPEADPEILKRNIICTDYLKEGIHEKYDRIIGNPPWGSVFTEEEKAGLRERYLCADKKKIEAYDLFLEQAMCDLKPEGKLLFVVPEAVMNVGAHKKIREVIMEKARIRSVDYLGEVFDGVQCPSVILGLGLDERFDLEKEQESVGRSFSTMGIHVTDGKREFLIRTERSVTAESFPLCMTDEEYKLLEKIDHYKNRVYLKGNAEFALGIVTGNNRELIYDHEVPGSERILKGSDIRMYRYEQAERYIIYTPEKFQQVASEEIYRAPEKLLYRFISDRPVVAYDNRQILSLNSANILIPHIPGMDMRYIMAYLNSDLAAFYYRKRYGSVKVLKSHLEAMPIPVLPKEIQQEIILLTETGNHAEIEEVLCKYLHMKTLKKLLASPKCL